jgi:hypothetical protein
MLGTFWISNLDTRICLGFRAWNLGFGARTPLHDPEGAHYENENEYVVRGFSLVPKQDCATSKGRATVVLGFGRWDCHAWLAENRVDPIFKMKGAALRCPLVFPSATEHKSYVTVTWLLCSTCQYFGY